MSAQHVSTSHQDPAEEGRWVLEQLARVLDEHPKDGAKLAREFRWADSLDELVAAERRFRCSVALLAPYRKGRTAQPVGKLLRAIRDRALEQDLLELVARSVAAGDRDHGSEAVIRPDQTGEPAVWVSLGELLWSWSTFGLPGEARPSATLAGRVFAPLSLDGGHVDRTLYDAQGRKSREDVYRISSERVLEAAERAGLPSDLVRARLELRPRALGASGAPGACGLLTRQGNT